MNGLFTLGWNDVTKGLVMAILTGLILPIAAAVQSPGFSLETANWYAILILAANGAIVGFVGYMMKNFFSTNDGALFGKIGKPKA